MLHYQVLEINVLIQAAQFVPFSTCDSVGYGDEASRGKMLLRNMTLSLKWQAGELYCQVYVMLKWRSTRVPQSETRDYA